jgi:hypothetical protein
MNKKPQTFFGAPGAKNVWRRYSHRRYLWSRFANIKNWDNNNSTAITTQAAAFTGNTV